MNKENNPTNNRENTFTRRTVLKMIGAAAGTVAMTHAMQGLGFAKASTYDGPMRLEGSPKDTSIIILGAGVAGMLAAYELEKVGYKVTLLEYREKAGGRCWTLRGGDSYTELGGYSQKCEFDSPGFINPGPWRIPYHHYGVLDYCRLLDVELAPFVQLNMNAYYHSPNAFGGKPQRVRHVLTDMQGHVAELLAKEVHQDKLSQPFTGDDKDMVLKALKGWGNLNTDYSYISGPHVSGRRGYKVDPGGGQMPRAVDSDIIPFLELVNSGLWKYISSYQSYEYQQTMFEPKGGMDMIAKGFEAKVGHLIKYKSQVSRIKQDDKKVKVSYRDLSTGTSHEISADWCFCTIPLSILSQMELDVGADMRRAINAVPYETGFKAGLQFKRRFWEEDDKIFGGVSFTSSALRNISYPAYDMNKGGKGVLLGCYTFGPDSYKFSSLEPAERLKKVLELGEKIHPQYKDEFENGITVGWHRVPWTNGCHGMWTEETRKKHYDNLSQIDGRLILAGEHLSFWPAWIEGAILSGMDATERLHKRVMETKA